MKQPPRVAVALLSRAAGDCGLPFLQESDSLDREQEGSQCCAFLFIWRLLCNFCFILIYSTVCVHTHIHTSL